MYKCKYNKKLLVETNTGQVKKTDKYLNMADHLQFGYEGQGIVASPVGATDNRQCPGISVHNSNSIDMRMFLVQIIE